MSATSAEERAKHDPFGSRVPDHSVVHRYARCISYPEWGVGTVTGIYFSGDEEASQQWARVSFQVGVRTIPAGSLQFVDFSKPDAAADRVERFMTAAQHALAEGDAELAAQRLVYARDAEPDNPAVLRLLTAAFWQAGNLPAAGADGPRLGAGGDRPSDARALRLADLRGHGRGRSRRRRGPARRRARAGATPRRGSDSAGCGCGWATGAAAISALERARLIGPTLEGLLDLALAHHLAGDVGAEVSVAEAATQIAPESRRAWSTYAHALARTDRLSECEEACRQALALGPDPEVADLLERIRGSAPRALSEPSAA